MTADRRADIRARLDAATPGPWEHVRAPFRDTASHSVKRGEQVLALVGWEREEAVRAPADAELIAHAPADLRWLLDEVERPTESDKAWTEAERDLARHMDLLAAARATLAALVADVEALGRIAKERGSVGVLPIAAVLAKYAPKEDR